MLVIGEEEGEEQKRRREDVEKFSASLELIMRLGNTLMNLVREGCEQYQTWTERFACADQMFIDTLMGTNKTLETHLAVSLSSLPVTREKILKKQTN